MKTVGQKSAKETIAAWVQLESTWLRLGFKVCMRDSQNKPRVVALDSTDHLGRGIVVAQGKSWEEVLKVLIRKKLLKKGDLP